MIDFIKVQVKNIVVDDWLQRSNFTTKFLVDSNGEQVWHISESGNKYRRLDAVVHGFKVRIREIKSIKNDEVTKYLTLEGSLHKFYKGENYSPFTWYDLQNSLYKFCALFNLELHDCILTHLEFGVNIYLEQRPIDLINENLLSYDLETLNKYNPDERGKKIGVYIEKTNFIYKLYDKSYQYDLKDVNILRAENHSKKMVDIRSTDIVSLMDLLDIKKVNLLKPILSMRFDNLKFIDTEVNHKMIPESKKKIYIIGRSLHEQRKVPYKYRSLYRKEFRQLMATYGKDYSEILSKKLSLKWDELINEREVIHQMHTLINVSEKGVIHSKVENDLVTNQYFDHIGGEGVGKSSGVPIVTTPS